MPQAPSTHAGKQLIESETPVSSPFVPGSPFTFPFPPGDTGPEMAELLVVLRNLSLIFQSAPRKSYSIKKKKKKLSVPFS